MKLLKTDLQRERHVIEDIRVKAFRSMNVTLEVRQIVANQVEIIEIHSLWHILRWNDLQN